MGTSYTEKNFAGRLELFFKNSVVEAVLLFLISASVVAAIASLLFHNDALEHLNLFFSVVFSIELTARYFTYDGKKKEYFRDWWMDWLATIPWDIFLFFLFPGGRASMLRLLRLPRIFRILRFRRIKKSEPARWLSYRFRRLLEVSIWRQSMTLLLVSLIFVWIFALMLDKVGMHSEHGDNFWFSLITMISSDSIFELHGQESLVKGLVLLLSFIGIVLFNGILIAIIIGKLMEYLGGLKNGEVREKDHIILLGWSECIPHIVAELEDYCVSERKHPVKVVVMTGDSPASAGRIIGSSPHVKVISRVGSFQNEEALERISAHKAAAVIVLGDAASDRKLSERLNDPVVTRTLVSLETLLDDKRKESRSPVIILNYLDLGKSLHVTEFLRPFGSRSTKIFFNPLFFAGKLIASMCVNPYSEAIYNELLSSQGNEFHSVRFPLEEKTCWEDIALSFPRSIPVGYRDSGGEFRMAPLPGEVLPDHAEIVVLSENEYDSRIFDFSRTEIRKQQPDLSLCSSPIPRPSGTLVVVGVNPKLPFIIEGMNKMDVRLNIVDNQTEDEFAEWYGEYSKTPLPEGLVFNECRFRSEDEVRLAIDLDSTNRIILLADGYLLNEATPDQIDAETVSKLLMLSQLIERDGREEIHLIVETLTTDSEIVVRNIRNCSNVIGPLTTGRLLTTFALEPKFEPVFRTIIQFGDIDIVCRSMTDAVAGWKSGGKTFGELLSLSHDGCIPLGWVENINSAAEAGGEAGETQEALRRIAPRVRLNPPKSSEIPPEAEIVFLQRQKTYDPGF